MPVAEVVQHRFDLGPSQAARRRRSFAFEAGGHHALLRADSHIPDRLSEIEPLDRAQATVTREFSFRGGRLGDRHGWTIGGQPYSPSRIDARPRLGDVEIWRFVVDLHHPIHLHLVNFRVLSRGGHEPGPYDAGRKDTVDLRPGEAVEVIARFDGYRGRYMFHCHNVEHEDMSMMANFETV